MQAHEVPPPVQMIQIFGGGRVSQALHAAAALGVADHLVAAPAPRRSSQDTPACPRPDLRRTIFMIAPRVHSRITQAG
jgi:hypothetical protein